jgi:hypothetical protein
MFEFLRKSAKVLVLKDAGAFWKHCDSTQRIQHTPDGPAADAEERLDLRAGQAIKTLLESEVGPEEGPAPVQMQNWDWNDDRCRGVGMLTQSFKPDLIPKLQALLVGEFADFQVIVSLYEDWKSEAWGHLKLSATQIAVQRNVAQAYAIAA